MSVRPIDFQPILNRTPDVTRETATQQHAAAAQQALSHDEDRRHAQRLETVHQSDEPGAAAIHEREARSGGDQGEAQDEDTDQPATGTAAELKAVPGAVKPRVGRHVDLQA